LQMTMPLTWSPIALPRARELLTMGQRATTATRTPPAPSLADHRYWANATVVRVTWPHYVMDSVNIYVMLPDSTAGGVQAETTTIPRVVNGCRRV
jgi:hypothetical protein